jgi:hypothetical protein
MVEWPGQVWSGMTAVVSGGEYNTRLPRQSLFAASSFKRASVEPNG